MGAHRVGILSVKNCPLMEEFAPYYGSVIRAFHSFIPRFGSDIIKVILEDSNLKH
jgi:hypothetical protein